MTEEPEVAKYILKLSNEVRQADKIQPYVDEIIHDEARNAIANPYFKNSYKRLSRQQTKILELQFEKNSEWKSDYIKKLAKRLGLDYQKVYKWSWQHKQKAARAANKKLPEK